VQSVMKVLMAYKTNDIDASVKALDQGRQDVLMKYIYRGFELSSDSNGYGAQLLVWHDKVALCYRCFSKGGPGGHSFPEVCPHWSQMKCLSSVTGHLDIWENLVIIC